jgi:hypothetical protein
MHINNGHLGGTYGDGGWNAPYSRVGVATEQAVMVAGDWQHVAVVFNAHQDIQLYRNCMEQQVLRDNGTGSSMQYSTANGALGLGSPLVGNAQNYTGAIDDVRVYNRALSSVEITGICQEGPGWFGNTLQTMSSYEFFLQLGAQKTESIQLFNTGDVSRSATLKVVNPHSEQLPISLQSSNPVTIAPGASENVPLVIDATSASPGTYEGISLEVAVDDGSTFYSNITVYVTEGSANLPDLTVRSEDISSGDPTTLTATIGNRGSSPASNVKVEFYELDTLLGSSDIDTIAAGGAGSASITIPALSSGDHLIRVVLDPSGMIQELDENNNEASHIIQPEGPSPTPGHILVTGSLPSTVYADSLFSLTGHAVYDITVGGVRYTNYVVKGGSVEITIKGDDGTEWLYGGSHTNINGNFTKYLKAPTSPGTYHLLMTVTDQTFRGTRELEFTVTERPVTPPPPPPPPSFPPGTGPGPGDWVCDGDTCTWTPPDGQPVPYIDARIFSENIHFSENNPAADEEITVFAEIQYWATSTDLVAENIPINVYVTKPGEAKEKIAEAVIPRLSVGAPEYGSRYVYTTWKNPGESIYIVEVEIPRVEIPNSVEENYTLNNAATRAIIVGTYESGRGAIAGKVTDALGGVGGVTIQISDASGPIGSTVTDATGFYLFENVLEGDYDVQIVAPEGTVPDAEVKPANVADQSVSTVNFLLTEQAETDTTPPTITVPADITAEATSPEGAVVTYEASATDDVDGEVAVSCEPASGSTFAIGVTSVRNKY